MENRDFQLQDRKKGATLAVRVTPRASKNEIVGILNDGTIKIHLTATPVEGKANEALLKFLAKLLDVSISQLKLVAGASGRNKLISVAEMDPKTLQKKILAYIG
jgi:uncharacterized protein (TIGR00251 family)